ncbi:CE295 protein, partial [Geococcyx californianus]|nr:CE295 protein [Geococcyx californianus]
VQGIPFDLSSTISTGSFLTSETLDASPVGSGLSSDSTEDQAWGETASCPSSSSLPFTLRQRQENLSGASETQSPKGEMHLCKTSHVLQILRKGTGDLNSYPEDNAHFQALSAEPDFPEMEISFLNFHHQPFQPLEPSPDFDTSSSSSQDRISRDSRAVSKTSKVSRKIQDKSAFLEVGTSSLNIKRSNMPSGLKTNRSNNITSEESVRDSVT